ncbi:MAG: Gfo/Idh/MocA family oxidoreductase, partial [Caldilineaceae bacterium]|nr:Gfo/Idh/MocA family oxidoreductase [Caldilineaceae bacterium]
MTGQPNIIYQSALSIPVTESVTEDFCFSMSKLPEISKTPVRLLMVGCGGMARHHVRHIIQQQDTTTVAMTCEPSGTSYELFAEEFAAEGLMPPPNVPELATVLRDHAGELDAAFIITPHALHHDQAKACLEAALVVQKRRYFGELLPSQIGHGVEQMCARVEHESTPGNLRHLTPRAGGQLPPILPDHGMDIEHGPQLAGAQNADRRANLGRQAAVEGDDQQAARGIPGLNQAV